MAPAKKAGTTETAFKLICNEGADKNVVLELLYHHVTGKYPFGADARRWTPFRRRLLGLRRKALELASELHGFSKLKIFSVPLVPLVPKAFLAREKGLFMWEIRTDNPSHASPS